jgi:hypothetical protein
MFVVIVVGPDQIVSPISDARRLGWVVKMKGIKGDKNKMKRKKGYKSKTIPEPKYS